MTKEEIMKLEGKELDILVAKEVLEYYVDDNNYVFDEYGCRDPFEPSRDMETALEVIEKMDSEGWKIAIYNQYSYGLDPDRPFKYGVLFEKHYKGEMGYGPTIPLAVCRAALIVVQPEFTKDIFKELTKPYVWGSRESF